MRNLDLSRCVPELPEGYMDALGGTFAKLKAENSKKRLPARKMIIAAAVAATLLITAALALTNGLGVMDFIRSFAGGENVLPEAEKMVEDLSGFQEVRTSRVIYQAVDALFVDGKLNVTIAARPIDAEKYLIADDMGWSEGQTKPAGSDKTYERIAMENGQTLLDCGVSIEDTDGFGSSCVKDGETLYIYLDAELPVTGAQSGASINITCLDYPTMEISAPRESPDAQMNGIEKVDMALNIRSNEGTIDKASIDAPVRGLDMTVDEAVFSRTPFESVIRVRYTVNGEKAAKLNEKSVYCSFFWMKDGESFDTMQGDISSANTRFITEDENGKTYETTRNWQTIDALPEVIYLRAWYWEAGEWGEVIEVRSDGK